MKTIVKNITTEIEELAKNSNLDEKQILDEINKYFEIKTHKNIIKQYKKRKVNVTELCKEFDMSSKRFYKILKKNKVKLNTKSKK